MQQQLWGRRAIAASGLRERQLLPRLQRGEGQGRTRGRRQDQDSRPVASRRAGPGDLRAGLGAAGYEPTPAPIPKEFKTCNPEGCPEVRRNTPWTPWLPVNVTQGGARQEQRFRFTCRAPLPDPHGLQFGRRRTETRTCPADSSGTCDTDGTTPQATLLPRSRAMGRGRGRGRGGWAQELGVGRMHRLEKLLLLRPVFPPAALVEDLLRRGGTAQHTVSGGWAAWGPWSPCSRDCELGFHVRKRTCTNPEPRNGGLPCVGDATEYQDCNPQACPGNAVLINLGSGKPPPRETSPQGTPIWETPSPTRAIPHAQVTSSSCQLDTKGPRTISCPEHGLSSCSCRAELFLIFLSLFSLLKWASLIRSLF